MSGAFPLPCGYVVHALPLGGIYGDSDATLLLVVTNAGSSSGPGSCNPFFGNEIWSSPPLRFFLLRSVRGAGLALMPARPRYQMRFFFLMVDAAN